MHMHTFRALTARVLTAGALVAGLALAGCATGGTGSAQPTPTASGTASAQQPNAADTMFTMMMIPHHEQAIEMSDVVLGKPDVDPRVRDLAQRIKDAQGPEIAQMEAWLDAWGMHADPHAGMGHGGGMGGMMSEDDIEALEQADGAAASALFLEQMIEHHEGAIEMAETEVRQGAMPDVIALAESIIESQRAEITEMEGLLDEL
ncbi:DUF305 domain-containing protein [Agrococcus carbonis]|uniref:Uncharacterized conserved protein, DUF305 family n=1 Tax=Agrococcus carbonis TaxID=684552 RepID=A0A1H1NLR3_9MICO|nr:DUF305 domain-containing protein [Agrococcus carbonis]SDR99803.1 Uncharacterized conserved protein, DUF305 family [Agrococcus carbonis]